MSSSNVTSVVNHFSNANEGFLTTLSSSILSGATTIPLTTVSGLTNGDIFVGIIEPSLTKQQTFTGTVDTSGSQLTGVVWTRGTNADHTAGVTIVDYVAGTGHNMMKKGILVGHNQNGTHKSGATYTAPVLSGTVTGTYEMAGTGTYTNPTLTTPIIKTFDGWQTGSGTWTYASATTFTVPAGDAAVMSAGTKIKLTQTTVKYFYVTGVSGTTVTVTGGSDYTVANAAITLPFLSNEETPYNFPQYFNYTPTFTNLTGGTLTYSRFSMIGKDLNFRLKYVLAGAGISGLPRFTLPVTMGTYGTEASIFKSTYQDTGTRTYNGTCLLASTSAADMVVDTVDTTFSYTASVSSTAPHVWAATDVIVIIGTYEVA